MKPVKEDKIKEQFHYYNIQAEIDSVYGNWAVSSNGDVVNFLYPNMLYWLYI